MLRGRIFYTTMGEDPADESSRISTWVTIQSGKMVYRRKVAGQAPFRIGSGDRLVLVNICNASRPIGGGMLLMTPWS